MSKKIPVDATPKETDKFLQENYGISLYYFAISLVDIFYLGDIRAVKLFEGTPSILSWREFWSKRLNELKKLNNSAIKCDKTWHSFYKRAFFLKQCYPNKVSSVAKNILKLEDLIKSVYILSKDIQDEWLTPTQKKGAIINPINILFLVWLISLKDKRTVHFQSAVSLMRWFSIRIPGFYFKEDDIEEENLKKIQGRFRRGKSKQVQMLAQEFGNRFFAIVKLRWLENKIIDTADPDISLIRFTNGERLMVGDFLENRHKPKTASQKKDKDLPKVIAIDFEQQITAPDSVLWDEYIHESINHIRDIPLK